MAKKVLQRPELPAHLYFYVHPGSEEPVKIPEDTIPSPPYKRFETMGEARSYIMINQGYCSASKNVREPACPQRFNCQKYSNFFKLAGGGKFKNVFMNDLFKWAPFGTTKEKEFNCSSFEEKIK